MNEELLKYTFMALNAEFKKEFYGDEIKNFISSLGMTYQEFANEMNFSLSKVKAMANNRIECDRKLFFIINKLVIRKKR